MAAEVNTDDVLQVTQFRVLLISSDSLSALFTTSAHIVLYIFSIIIKKTFLKDSPRVEKVLQHTNSQKSQRDERNSSGN